MTDNEIGNLVVTKNKRPVGILKEREVLRFLASWMKIPNNILSYFTLQSGEALTPLFFFLLRFVRCCSI
jgi:signal-transduction protein with cAMP-binding, CBS, and nucleotidyltransferase domain